VHYYCLTPSVLIWCVCDSWSRIAFLVWLYNNELLQNNPVTLVWLWGGMLMCVTREQVFLAAGMCVCVCVWTLSDCPSVSVLLNTEECVCEKRFLLYESLSFWIWRWTHTTAWCSSASVLDSAVSRHTHTLLSWRNWQTARSVQTNTVHVSKTLMEKICG